METKVTAIHKPGPPNVGPARRYLEGPPCRCRCIPSARERKQPQSWQILQKMSLFYRVLLLMFPSATLVCCFVKHCRPMTSCRPQACAGGNDATLSAKCSNPSKSSTPTHYARATKRRGCADLLTPTLSTHSITTSQLILWRTKHNTNTHRTLAQLHAWKLQPVYTTHYCFSCLLQGIQRVLNLIV